MVATNQNLTDSREELRLTYNFFAQLALVLNMKLIMIHNKFVTHTICVSLWSNKIKL